ncbi:hypothetical protein OHA84_06910 [Streptomyces sp. NBC_00513]|uniref:hypothetical protein n=1 Tax=unclassified Streptomyces TaxID=2593676 RepID=UPI0022517629|nr:hypothetical protein [Streptomyces sp. NBC_00424]MCX5076723.1 hypothetical protein [Streptomyces sp. NBC_00424]WUD40260.1 hypothetical protein OHA84_06910 [Streptomyces sp. NBC_00513]
MKRDRNGDRNGYGTGTRSALMAGTVLATLALTGVAVPAHAATGERADAARRCTPGIRVLESLPGPGESPFPWSATTEVKGLGPLGMSVGRSQNRPVYWLGTSVHRVPLPAGYTSGAVEAVNRFGVMVGWLRGTDKPPVAFRYASGAKAVAILPGGERASDINDKGHVVGERHSDPWHVVGVEWVGTAVRRELALPPQITGLAEITGINDAGRIVGRGTGVMDAEYWYETGLVWAADKAAPAQELQPFHPGDTYSTYLPQDIDEKGRISGIYEFSRLITSNGVVWKPPYTEVITVANLGERTQGTFEDVSPTTGVSVGTASDSTMVGPFPPETAPPYQATLWKGTGPTLALPRLAATGHSGAFTVSDDDRVGGYAVDAKDVMRPVVWTCASQQAHAPAPTPTPTHATPTPAPTHATPTRAPAPSPGPAR